MCVLTGRSPLLLLHEGHVCKCLHRCHRRHPWLEQTLARSHAIPLSHSTTLHRPVPDPNVGNMNLLQCVLNRRLYD